MRPTVEQVARRLANEDDTLWEYLSTFRQDYWLRQARAVLDLFEPETVYYDGDDTEVYRERNYDDTWTSTRSRRQPCAGLA